MKPAFFHTPGLWPPKSGLCDLYLQYRTGVTMVPSICLAILPLHLIWRMFLHISLWRLPDISVALTICFSEHQPSQGDGHPSPPLYTVLCSNLAVV